MDYCAEWWQLKIFVFCYITQYRLVNSYRSFEGSNYFNLQDQTVQEDIKIPFTNKCTLLLNT